MKKLALMAMLALSVTMFAGCQSDEQAENPPATATQEPEATKEPVQDNVGAIDAPEATEAPVPTEAPAPTATPEPTATPTPEPLFDTSWAQNDFERMIPQPPFSGWVCVKDNGTTYELEAENVNPDGSLDYYSVFEAYAWSLGDCGYSVTGEFNEFEAVDAKGNIVELMCGDGGAWITIKLAQ